MKDIYQIEVNEETFQRMEDGKCNFVVVLDDKDHKAYKEGNILTIYAGEKSMKVSIREMLFFETVKELVDMIGKERTGFTKSLTTDRIEDEIAKTLKPESIEKFGLMAVGFDKIENSWWVFYFCSFFVIVIVFIQNRENKFKIYPIFVWLDFQKTLNYW